MNRSTWLTAAICVAGMVTFIWSMVWLVEQLAADRYPGRLAAKPMADMPPRVDLSAIQRGWPDSLDEPGVRSRLIAYQHDMKGQAPAPAAAAEIAPAAPLDLGTLLAGADANAGKDKARTCASCHDFAQGGLDRIGPNLWAVVGRDIASKPGFSYSSALTAQQGAWTYDRLFDYLGSPARAIPGTKMSFAGLRRPEDRAAVIKYLATLGGNVPPPPPQAAGAGAKAR